MKPLNQWARYYGYNDFDTYIRAGGSIVEAVDDIRKRIAVLQTALTELARGHDEPISHTIGLEDMKAIIADDTEDEPVDSQNAHPQGDDHVS
jgi:hypothetical protein